MSSSGSDLLDDDRAFSKNNAAVAAAQQPFSSPVDYYDGSDDDGGIGARSRSTDMSQEFDNFVPMEYNESGDDGGIGVRSRSTDMPQESDKFVPMESNESGDDGERAAVSSADVPPGSARSDEDGEPTLHLQAVELHIISPGAKAQEFHYDHPDTFDDYVTVAYEATYPTTLLSMTETDGPHVLADGPWGAWHGDVAHRGRANTSGTTRVALFFAYATKKDKNANVFKDVPRDLTAARKRLADALGELPPPHSEYNNEILKIIKRRGLRSTQMRGDARLVVLLPPATCKTLMPTLTQTAQAKLNEYFDMLYHNAHIKHIDPRFYWEERMGGAVPAGFKSFDDLLQGAQNSVLYSGLAEERVPFDPSKTLAEHHAGARPDRAHTSKNRRLASAALKNLAFDPSAAAALHALFLPDKNDQTFSAYDKTDAESVLARYDPDNTKGYKALILIMASMKDYGHYEVVRTFLKWYASSPQRTARQYVWDTYVNDAKKRDLLLKAIRSLRFRSDGWQAAFKTWVHTTDPNAAAVAETKLFAGARETTKQKYKALFTEIRGGSKALGALVGVAARAPPTSPTHARNGAYTALPPALAPSPPSALQSFIEASSEDDLKGQFAYH